MTQFLSCKKLATFRCYNPQTPDFRSWVMGNLLFPDRILPKIVFFVAKLLNFTPRGELGPQG
jgi:hypothetical protein